MTPLQALIEGFKSAVREEIHDGSMPPPFGQWKWESREDYLLRILDYWEVRILVPNNPSTDGPNRTWNRKLGKSPPWGLTGGI